MTNLAPNGVIDRAVVKHRTMEHLQRGAGRVLERDHLLYPASLGVVVGQLFERHPGAVQGCFDPLQRRVIAHFPADGEHPVGLTGYHDDPGRTLVHPQIQRRRVRSLAFGEAQDAEGEPPPAVDIVGRNCDVAKSFSGRSR